MQRLKGLGVHEPIGLVVLGGAPLVAVSEAHRHRIDLRHPERPAEELPFGDLAIHCMREGWLGISSSGLQILGAESRPLAAVDGAVASLRFDSMRASVAWRPRGGVEVCSWTRRWGLRSFSPEEPGALLAVDGRGRVLLTAAEGAHLLDGGGALLATLRSRWRLERAAISGDGAYALTSSTSDVLRVFDLRRGEEVAAGSPRGRVLRLAISSDGARALVATGRDELLLWQTRVEPTFVPLEGHQGRIVEVSMLEEGGRAVGRSVGGDGTVRRWSLEDGVERTSERSRLGQAELDRTPDDRFAVVSGVRRYLFDPSRDASVWSLGLPFASAADGEYLGACDERNVVVLDSTGATVRTLAPPIVPDLLVLPRGGRPVVVGSSDGRVWVEGGGVMSTGLELEWISLSPDGSRLAGGGCEGAWVCAFDGRSIGCRRDFGPESFSEAGERCGVCIGWSGNDALWIFVESVGAYPAGDLLLFSLLSGTVDAVDTTPLAGAFLCGGPLALLGDRRGRVWAWWAGRLTEVRALAGRSVRHAALDGEGPVGYALVEAEDGGYGLVRFELPFHAA